METVGMEFTAFMAGLPYGQVVTELEEGAVDTGVAVTFFCWEAGMGMLTLTEFLGGGMGALTDTGAFLAEWGAGAIGA